MTDPRQSDVWGKKPAVADRTINERKYCKPCDYYYSEMYTCPICYGDDRATERIIKLLQHEYLEMPSLEYEHFEDACVTCENIALIKGQE